MASGPRRSERIAQNINIDNSDAEHREEDDAAALDNRAAGSVLARQALRQLVGGGRPPPAAAAEEEASDEEAGGEDREGTPPQTQQATLNDILRAISKQSHELSQIKTRVAHIEDGDSFRPRSLNRSELPPAAAPRAQFPIPDAVSGDPSTDIKYLQKPQAPTKEYLVQHHPDNPHKLTKTALQYPNEIPALRSELRDIFTSQRDVKEAEVLAVQIARLFDLQQHLLQVIELRPEPRDDIDVAVEEKLVDAVYTIENVLYYNACTRFETLQLAPTLCDAFDQAVNPHRHSIPMRTTLGRQFARQVETRQLNLALNNSTLSPSNSQQ